MPAKDERETLAQGVQLGVAWVTVALFLLFGGTWLQEPISNPVAALLFLWLFATMVWSAFGAIKVADKLAEVLGEPLGSLVLTLTIIGLEGMLIGIAILTSDSGATIGRDTLFGANMIMINFAGGLALFLGRSRRFTREAGSLKNALCGAALLRTKTWSLAMIARRLGTVMLVAGVVAMGSQGSRGAEIRAGLAKVDITPPVGGKTTGYSGAPPTDGIHDRISGRVVVLESGETCVALVAVDLCVFDSPWLHGQMTGIGVDRLLLMNTHTHSGPDMDQADFPSKEEPWRRTVEERLLGAIKEAKEGLFPAFFAAGEGAIALGYNRLVPRGEFAETHFNNPDRIPYGPIDPTVGLIRITDEGGQLRAVLVSYACHPVVLGPRNAQISADYPGVMREIVEKELGNDAMCVFIQGGGGDINPLIMAREEAREGDFALVQRMGELLAGEVVKVLEGMEEKRGASDGFKAAWSTFKVGDRWEPEKELKVGVTSLLINGEIGIVTMPGEPFHRFQVELREKARLPHAFFYGYCCDDGYEFPNYVPDLVSAARGGYGASDTTHVEVGAGERLVNKGITQLYLLRGHLKPKPQRHVFDQKAAAD